MNETILFTLINGQEIIAKAVGENPGSVNTKNPMVIVQTQEGMGLMPYSFMMKEEVLFLSSAIAAFGEPVEELVKQYREHTGEIILPDNKIILN